MTRTTGHGFAACPRLRLLQVLSDRARELGAEVRFNETVEDATALDADLVVLADGVNSSTRQAMEERFAPRIVPGAARYAWFGTRHDFGIFTFLFERTPTSRPGPLLPVRRRALHVHHRDVRSRPGRRPASSPTGVRPGETDPRPRRSPRRSSATTSSHG